MNYITPVGFEKLKQELKNLLHKERPKIVESVAWAASNGDRSENADYIYGKRRLREIDRRVEFLTKRLESAKVVDPKTVSSKKIVFGATVKIADGDGQEKTYQIVGEDEIDVTNNKISWKSPVATALLGRQEGDEARIRKPSGLETVDILKVSYE